MLFADFIDSLVTDLCSGFVIFLGIVAFLLYCLGSAISSIFSNDAVQDVAKNVAEETAKSGFQDILEWWFGDD